MACCCASSTWAQNNNWGGVQQLGRPTVTPNNTVPQGGYYNGAGGPNMQGNGPGVRMSPDPRIATLPQTGVPNPAANTAKAEAATAGDPANTEGKIPVRNLLQMFHDGGFMMYPIALCSFALMVFSFERFIALRRGRVIPRPFVNRLIEQLQQQQIDREEALELCDRHASPMAKILGAAVKRYGKPSVEVEQAVLDAGERESNFLRRNMRILSAISNVSPLLGLLGTVMGMIQSFNDISSSQAMGRPEMLAGGISEALLTTAAGLLVAIPAYLVYIYFVGHIDRLIMEMDLHSQRLIDVISAEGLQESDVGRAPRRSRKAA
jgi:biopolymer transport protein ExbB